MFFEPKRGDFRVLSLAIGFATLATVLCLHPFVTYPGSLLLLPRRPLKQRSANAAGLVPASVAICMSAYNEDAVIAAKMDSLLTMAHEYPGEATVHVYADAPSDRTVEILEAYSDRADIVIGTERRGKSWGMAQLVLRSQSDLLLFSDANVASEPDAIIGLAATFDDPEVGLASAQLVYSNPAESATSKSGAFYWAFEERIKRIESATVGLVGVDGAMFMIRRALYRAPPPHLIDDLFVSLTTLISGARVISVQSVTVFERSSSRAEEEFNRKKRIACQAWNVHRALWPELKRLPPLKLYAYFSHRVLKWLTPFLVLLVVLSYAAVIAELTSWPVAVGIVVGGAAALALGSAIDFQPMLIVSTMLYSLAGVGLGLLQSIFQNKTYTVWQPADSVRVSPASAVGPQNVATNRRDDPTSEKPL